MNTSDKPSGFFSRLLGRDKVMPEPQDLPVSPDLSLPDRFPISNPPDEEISESRQNAQPQETPEEDETNVSKTAFDESGSKIALLGISDVREAAHEEKPSSWWQRLREGMRRTSSTLGGSVADIFTKRRLDNAMLDDLEDVLIQADLGVNAATRMIRKIREQRFDREISPREVKEVLAEEIEKALVPVALPFIVDRAVKPYVVLMVGVNGSGKTTTIGKIAAKARAKGLSVMLAAGDTFRAAAIEQLKVWGTRNNVPVIARHQGSDAAGLAFDAMNAAREEKTDLLLIDTAGRLQNKTGLMAELEKIVRVIKKSDESAPHAVLLVLDATVGQNALSQVELFRQAAKVTGLVMTKLDGTARGGILVALADKHQLPIHFIGVGEDIDDLEPFSPRDFACALVGLEPQE